VSTARILTAFGAGYAARLAYTALTRRPEAGKFDRTNHRGQTLTLLQGPAVTLGTAAAMAVVPGVPGRWKTAGVLATVAAGGFGAYDDLAGDGDRRGFKGHLGALAKGELTTGGVKILGIGVTGLIAGAMVQRKPLDKLLAGVVIAGTANLVNLFDLRPGRASKALLIAGAPAWLRGGAPSVLAAAPMGAAVGLLPEDLGERSMLGDCGANALGAALGVAAAARAGRFGLIARAGLLVGLTLASEKVSFTKVIAGHPVLNSLDMLGRKPAAVPAQKQQEDAPAPA
jgi:UDP-N-acetylmuramyl pentapeptide phosphotransferase/UDP-N-acetylglucosamine-1-phosphate transferase